MSDNKIILPNRENLVRIEKHNNDIKVIMCDTKQKTTINVYCDGKYSYKHIVKDHNGCYILKNINDANNVRVKLSNNKKVYATSNTLYMSDNNDSREKRTNETVTGYLSSYKHYQVFSFTVYEAVKILLKATPDFDLYANWDNTNSWQFRSETWSGNETLDIPKPEHSRILYVLVYRYSGSGSFSLQLQPQIQSTENIYWTGYKKKKALISGISDYLNISDLSYCDEDVMDWYNYLTSQGYECRVLGDSHPMNFPRYDGLATKNNMRNAVKSLVTSANYGDTIAFITSGHGAGDGIGNSYLCTYDGLEYNDTELYHDIKQFDGNKIVIVDHCFSGGFADNLDDLPNMFFGATCSKAGYGYDMGEFKNGAFTYAWQEILHTTEPTTLVNQFHMVKEIYEGSDDRIDEPMYICTNNELHF